MIDYPALFAVFTTFIGIIGASIGISRSIDARFSELRSQMHVGYQELSRELSEVRQACGISDTRDLSKLEALEYRINANRELIEHRTQRFCDEQERSSKFLQDQIDEVKQFLDRTTEFTIRGKRENL